eukprot:GHVH01008799.1.p1 GENE.GHVH01008799.1~~GHVH01008799.1.p1  ORF type:complete len:337 (+),score=22.85 GHVH01008799.1:164-1174(+)
MTDSASYRLAMNGEANYEFDGYVFYVCFIAFFVGLLVRKWYFDTYSRLIKLFIASGDLNFLSTCCPWALRLQNKHGGPLIIESYGNMDALGICNVKGFVLVSYHCWIDLIFIALYYLCRIFCEHDDHLFSRCSTFISVVRPMLLQLQDLIDWSFNSSGILNCICLKVQLQRLYCFFYRLFTGEHRPSPKCALSSSIATFAFVLTFTTNLAVDGLMLLYSVREKCPLAAYLHTQMRYGYAFGALPIVGACLISFCMQLIEEGSLVRLSLMIKYWNRVPGLVPMGCGMNYELLVRLLLLLCEFYKIVNRKSTRDVNFSTIILVYDACPPLIYVEFGEV